MKNERERESRTCEFLVSPLKANLRSMLTMCPDPDGAIQSSFGFAEYIFGQETDKAVEPEQDRRDGCVATIHVGVKV